MWIYQLLTSHLTFWSVSHFAAVTISNTRFGNAAGHAEVDPAAHTISLPPTYRRMFLEQQRQQDERSFQRRQDSTSPLPLHDDQVPQPQQAPQMMDGQHQHQNQLDRQSGAIDASSQAESRHNVVKSNTCTVCIVY